MVPAYNDPVVWEGHASMITEIARQLPPGTKPDAVVCSVGGGGLGNGVMLGCKAVGWDDGESSSASELKPEGSHLPLQHYSSQWRRTARTASTRLSH